jgi:hypothetical protein
VPGETLRLVENCRGGGCPRPGDQHPILRYNRAQPAAYPNGRALTDDVFSARFAWLTHGRVTSQGLKPRDDLLAEFPYLGPPNLYPVG